MVPPESKLPLRPLPNTAPLICQTKLNTVRLWSNFGANLLGENLSKYKHGTLRLNLLPLILLQQRDTSRDLPELSPTQVRHLNQPLL